MSDKKFILHTNKDKRKKSDAAPPVQEFSFPEEPSQTHTTGVDLNGLMTVLGRHLYSTPVVALRELVQNAHDSIIRRRIEDPALERSGGQGADGSPKPTPAMGIRVTSDQAKGIIRITDTGAGLTPEEIRTYLATVGLGYTRNLREKDDSSGLIGMFGLGFLSAFVLASEVTVNTTSYQTPDQGWCYQSTTGEQYTLTPIAPRPVGTEVVLTLREDFTNLAGMESLHKTLARYCILLREPVYVGDKEASLNAQTPPWRIQDGNTLEHPVWLQKKRLEFARQFDSWFEPICTIPVVPSPLPMRDQSDAAGLLWVQDGGTYGNSDNRQLLVFGRGMLLDEEARDLLPHWAGFISGVIESAHISPTASREDLQKDDVYYGTRDRLAEALTLGLANVAKTQPAAWRRVLTRHNEALLGASLCDDRLFDLLANSVRIPTSQGDLPASALKGENGLIHVMMGASGGFEDMLFRALRTPVARGDRYAVVPFLRKWVAAKGGTLVELGTDKGNRRLFQPEDLPQEETAWLTEALADGELLVPARFAPAELPVMVVPDREAELKRKLEEDEADKRISTAALRLARSFTAAIDDSTLSRLYVNLNNPAIIGLLESYRSGQEWQPQARLIRALKTIMAAGGEQENPLDINGALGTFTQVVASLGTHKAAKKSSKK